MVLSERNAELRLSELRQQREVIEREIRDLTLYLELGRRLSAGEPNLAGGTSDEAASTPAPRNPNALSEPTTAQPTGTAPSGAAGQLEAEPNASTNAETLRDAAQQGVTVAEATQALRAALHAHAMMSDSGAPESIPPDRPLSGAAPAPVAPAAYPNAVSEGAQARRYGRALVAQTLAILEQAKRPLHASEILTALQARGFSVPGHDPVAALNTRLWKRAGPDGVLRRLGDAVYALPQEEEA